MAWFEGVLEVDGAQISPGGTSLGLSTPMASDLRHTASVLCRPATVGGEVRRGGRLFAPHLCEDYVPPRNYGGT